MADFDNPDLDPAQTYYNWAIPIPPEPTTNVFTGDVNTFVTTINGASGPSITINTTLAGLSFSTAGSTITLAGTLGAASGGTGQTTYTKGDLLAASAATTLSKLATATNNARLATDSGTLTGLIWILASTGWGAASGTLSRAAYAAYAGQTVSNPPTQVEVQAIDDALKLLSRTVAALITDLTTQKLINP